MTRTPGNLVLRIVLAAGFAALLGAALPAPAAAAPSSASSRMRSFAGSMEIVVPAMVEPYVLDSIAVNAIRSGYALVSSDREHLRLRLEEPATLEEVTVIGATRLAGTERKRLQFEVVNADGNRLRILGVITLVTDPGATNEIEEDMGKRQPFRNELKALFQEVRAGLIP